MMPSSNTDTKLTDVWNEMPGGLTASDIDYLSQILQPKYNHNADGRLSQSSNGDDCSNNSSHLKASDDILLPQSFDPLLQKKIMLENELDRLEHRDESLRSALNMIDRYEEELNNIDALRNPTVSIKEGKEELKLSLKLFNDYEFIESILTKQTVQHPKYLECLDTCKKHFKVLESKATWREAEVYRDKYYVLITSSIKKIEIFILKHFEDASKLESTIPRHDVGKCLEGVCERNKLLAEQLAPFCRALVDWEMRECAEVYVSYRMDVLRMLLPNIIPEHLSSIENLFLEEQMTIEALCLGSQPLKTLLEWIGNQLYSALRIDHDKEKFKKALLAYKGKSLPYKTLLELLSKE